MAIPDGWTSDNDGVTIIKKSDSSKYEIPPGYKLVSHKQLDRLGSYTTVAEQIRLTNAEMAEYEECLKKETPFQDKHCSELLDKLMKSYGGKRKSRKTKSKKNKSRKTKSCKTKSRKSKSRKKKFFRFSEQ
jgi:hypothetical protein